jgi:hypothetical protein
MVVPASSGGVSGFATGAVGCRCLTRTNLGSIWRSQTGHHARLSSISGLSNASRRPARSSGQMLMRMNETEIKQILVPFVKGIC